MGLFSLSGLLVGISCISMGIWVYIHRRSNPINTVWSLFCIFVSIWGFAGCAIGLSKDAASALVFWRVAYIGVILIPAPFYHFVTKFLEIKRPITLMTSYAMTVFFLAADFTPLMMPGTKWMFDELFYVSPPGLIYPYFVAFFIVLVAASHIDLGRYLVMTSTGRRREQIKWFFMATAVGFAGGITCFLPVFGIEIYPYGNLTVPLYPLIMTYAILRHQLLDIDVFIKKATIFTGMFAFSVGAIAIMSVFGRPIFQELFGWGDILSSIPSVLIILFAFEPLKNLLTNTTENFLFQKKFDYSQVLKLFVEDVLTVLDLRVIIKGTKDLIDKTIHPASFGIYLLDIGRNAYINQVEGDEKSLVPSAVFIQQMKERNKCVYIDQPGNEERVISELNEVEAVLAFPLESQGKFLGFMLLGKKKSGDDYTKDDIDILTDLSKTESIAILNAKATVELADAKITKHLAAMADGMSHQFKNRFHAIMGLLNKEKIFMKRDIEMMESEEKKYDYDAVLKRFKEIDTAIEKAESNCKRGASIANALLNRTRPDRKKQFDMNQVADAFGMGLSLIGFKHRDFNSIKIVEHIDHKIPKSWLSIGALEEICFNALDNSYDSIQDKKKLDPNYIPEIECIMHYKSESSTIQIVIKDNAQGIKAENLEKTNAGIPGFTTKGTSSLKSGFGAGISTMKELIQMHAGTYHYSSEWGKGSALTINIPVKSTPERYRKDERKGM